MCRLFQIAAVFVLALLAFAGCGGGDDDETTAQPQTTAATTLSKEELLAQGDAICAEVNAAVGTVGSTSADGGGQATQVADLYGGMAERLRGLGAPSGESAGYEEFIGAADELAQASDDVALAADRGKDGALATAETEAEAALRSFRSAASAFGFSECGEAPSLPSATPEAGGEEATEGDVEATPEAPEEEFVPEVEEEAEVAPETGGAGSGEEESSGGGAAAGGGEEGSSGGGGGNSGGIGPG